MSLAAKGGKDPWHPNAVPWDPACLGGTRGRRRPGRGQVNPLACAWHPAAARGEDAGGSGQAAALPRYRGRGGGGPSAGTARWQAGSAAALRPRSRPGGPGSSQPAPGLSLPAPAWLPGPAMRARSPGPSSPWDVKGIQHSAPGPWVERRARVWSCGEDGCRQGEVTSPGKYCSSCHPGAIGARGWRFVPMPTSTVRSPCKSHCPGEICGKRGDSAALLSEEMWEHPP